MTEQVYPRFHAKGGKLVPTTDQRGRGSSFAWEPTTPQAMKLTQSGEDFSVTVYIGSESEAVLPDKVYKQALDDARKMIAIHGLTAVQGREIVVGFNADQYKEYMRSFVERLRGLRHHAYGPGTRLIHHRDGSLTMVNDATGCESIPYPFNLSQHATFPAPSAHDFMRALPPTGGPEAAVDLFGTPMLVALPAALPAEPQPTVADHLAALLIKLQGSSRQGQEFDEQVVASIDELLDEEPAARTALLRIARGESASTGRAAWTPRVRWFAIEQLRHWPLPDADPAEFLPVPSYLETLIEAIEFWPEDEALYGAVVNARLVKAGVQRAKMRDALIGRLTGKLGRLDKAMTIFEAQLTGQTLCTFGSFALSDDLELLGRFALADTALAVCTHALEALRRVVCREPNAPATNAFFDAHSNDFKELCRSCLRVRRSSESAGTLLWSVVGVLLGRFGREVFIVADLARKFSELRQDIALEINRASEYLTQIGQTQRLEEQAEVKRQLVESVSDHAPGV